MSREKTPKTKTGLYRRFADNISGLQKWAFHYVGAAGNVFWMNQSRLQRLLGDYFRSANLLRTICHFGMFLVPTVFTDIFRSLSVWNRKELISQLKAHPDKADSIVKSFTGSHSLFWDAVEAIGHGLKNMNVLPILATLLNVYGGDLDSDNAIKNNVIFGIYIALTVLSFGYFANDKFNSNRKESESIAKDGCNALTTRPSTSTNNSDHKNEDIDSKLLTELREMAGIKSDESAALLV